MRMFASSSSPGRFPVKKKHEFVVTVEGCSRAEAVTVMWERIGCDEDYGFDYTIDFEEKF